MKLSIHGHFYFFSHTWNSKKYIIHLVILSRRRRQSMIIFFYHFLSLIFRQYNNLGKDIHFNIFRRVLNRYFRFYIFQCKLSLGSQTILELIAPWNFSNSETVKRPAHKMMDPFKQHLNVTTAYFRSGKIKAVIPALFEIWSLQLWQQLN